MRRQAAARPERSDARYAQRRLLLHRSRRQQRRQTRSAPCTTSIETARRTWSTRAWRFPTASCCGPTARRCSWPRARRTASWSYDVNCAGQGRRAARCSPTCRRRTTATGQIDNQPDGMCLDADGNLYVAHYGMKQVQVLDPSGQADSPLRRRQPDDQQRRLRRAEHAISSSSPAGWAAKRGRRGRVPHRPGREGAEDIAGKESMTLN